MGTVISKPMKNGVLLRALRRLVAMICISAATIVLLWGGTAIALYYEWISTIQIVPVAALGWLIVLGLWFVFTLMFGRIYCSTVCPLGVLMDIFACLPRMGRHAHGRMAYRYSPAQNSLRAVWLLCVSLNLVAGRFLLFSIFIPYCAYGRVVELFPRLAAAAEGSPLLWGTFSGIGIGMATLIIVAVVSVVKGRNICNTWCPVGTTLGVASRFSVYGFDINTDLCVGCNHCVDVCKAQCIDPGSHTVDNSRCVACFNCVAECPGGAMRYTRRRHRLQWPLLMRTVSKAQS